MTQLRFSLCTKGNFVRVERQEFKQKHSLHICVIACFFEPSHIYQGYSTDNWMHFYSLQVNPQRNKILKYLKSKSAFIYDISLFARNNGALLGSDYSQSCRHLSTKCLCLTWHRIFKKLQSHFCQLELQGKPIHYAHAHQCDSWNQPKWTNEPLDSQAVIMGLWSTFHLHFTWKLGRSSIHSLGKHIHPHSRGKCALGLCQRGCPGAASQQFCQAHLICWELAALAQPHVSQQPPLTNSRTTDIKMYPKSRCKTITSYKMGANCWGLKNLTQQSSRKMNCIQ